MLIQLKQTLEELRQRVRDNLITLYENDLEIQAILKESDSESETRLNMLKERESINKIITRENREALKIQVMIVNFLKQYNSIDNPNNMIQQVLDEKFPENKNFQNEEKNNKNINTIKQTINGELAYTESHPHYNNEQFIDELIDYYKKTK